MKQLNIFFSLLCVATMTIYADMNAQQVLQSGTKVNDADISRHRDSVTLSMKIDISGMDVKSGKSVILHPLFTSTTGTEKIYLPPVEVMGRTRSIYLERNQENVFPDDVYCRLVKKPNEPISVDYRITLPYDSWMDNSRLQIVEDLCGCGDVEKGSLIQLSEAVLSFNPRLAYVVPQSEPVKTREVSGRAFIDFRVNSTEIDLLFRNNPDELKRILASVDTVRNDKDFTITSLFVKGYASPEGSYALNKRLAEGRTESLRKYLLDQYGFLACDVKSFYEPENWEGLVEYIKTSTLSDKDAILHFIENGPEDVDRKEREIMIKFPKSYSLIFSDCYPGLRRTDYRIDYVIRNFNLEEARRMVRIAPQRLSMEEMFAVAQTYEPGSDEFNYVFEVAVKMYPDSDVANINAACALLEQGMAKKALEYLEKVKLQVPEAENARGVAYILLKDYELAEQHIKIALEDSLEEAKYNMEFLK